MPCSVRTRTLRFFTRTHSPFCSQLKRLCAWLQPARRWQMKSFVPLVLFGMLSATANLMAQSAHEYWFLVENGDHTIADFMDANSIKSEKHGLKRAWVV